MQENLSFFFSHFFPKRHTQTRRKREREREREKKEEVIVTHEKLALQEK
jgi:hypothetical protein